MAVAKAESLARQTQRRSASALERSESRLFARNVIAGHRHDALPLGQLQLEHHHGLLAEGHLRRREVELPHSDEALVIKPLGLFAVGEEALAPGLERLGVVQAQDFD